MEVKGTYLAEKLRVGVDSTSEEGREVVPFGLKVEEGEGLVAVR